MTAGTFYAFPLRWSQESRTHENYISRSKQYDSAHAIWKTCI